MVEEAIEGEDSVADSGRRLSELEEVFDGVRPGELKGSSEEDQVQMAGEDLDISWNRRLPLLLRPKCKSRVRVSLLDNQDYVATTHEQHDPHEE